MTAREELDAFFSAFLGYLSRADREHLAAQYRKVLADERAAGKAEGKAEGYAEARQQAARLVRDYAGCGTERTASAIRTMQQEEAK